jgi:hypothetical protein
MNPECVNCSHLGSCGLTDEQKILSHFVCIHFVEVANKEIVRARCDVINRFGDAGLKSLINPDPQEI